MHVPLQLWSAFVTLLVTIGPVEAAAVFASLTGGVRHVHRRTLAMRATFVAGVVLLVFALAGNLFLALLRVTLPAFQIAAGLLLFLQALTLTFATSGVSSLSEGEQREAESPGDIAVFPLAFPVIAGPDSLSAVVLLMGRSESWLDSGVILVMLLLCLVITFIAMLAADWLARWLGKTGTDVIGRISGILLAALAVQFVLDGLRTAFRI
jgi:multiple antibiotic resistance protein